MNDREYFTKRRKKALIKEKSVACLFFVLKSGYIQITGQWAPLELNKRWTTQARIVY